MITRHLLAIAVLPGTVTILVPLWIARRRGIGFDPPAGAQDLLLIAVGVIALAVGLLLFVASLRRFVRDGRGTLAPWDPPRHLVVRGPYRYVRNPMISGVLFVLVGEALILRSFPHTLWASIFLLANAIWIPLYEEPNLQRLFGDEYREYRRHVRRFLPRLRPWNTTA